MREVIQRKLANDIHASANHLFRVWHGWGDVFMLQLAGPAYFSYRVSEQVIFISMLRALPMRWHLPSRLRRALWLVERAASNPMGYCSLRAIPGQLHFCRYGWWNFMVTWRRIFGCLRIIWTLGSIQSSIVTYSKYVKTIWNNHIESVKWWHTRESVTFFLFIMKKTKNKLKKTKVGFMSKLS